MKKASSGGFLQHLAVAGTSNSNRGVAGVALYQVVNKNLAPSNTSLIQILVYRWIYPFFWAIFDFELRGLQPALIPLWHLG